MKAVIVYLGMRCHISVLPVEHDERSQDPTLRTSRHRRFVLRLLSSSPWPGRGSLALGIPVSKVQLESDKADALW